MNNRVVKFAHTGNTGLRSGEVDWLQSAPVVELRTGNPVQIPPSTGRISPLEQILRDMNCVRPGDLLKAITIHARQDCSLGDILLARGMISEDDLLSAEERRWDCCHINPEIHAPDPRLIALIGTRFCLEHRILPWRQIGQNIVLLTSDPDHFARATAALPDTFPPVSMALCTQRRLTNALLDQNQLSLAQEAETCVAEDESFRSRKHHLPRWKLAIPGIGILAAAVFFPTVFLAGLFFWSILTLMAFTTMKVAACFAQQKHHREQAKQEVPQPRLVPPLRLPRVSVLVPLFRENQIAEQLIKRLSLLEYPRELLEICLVAEEDDLVTLHAISETKLPGWMRPVVVPAGKLRTKPRALNFALDFCSGSIIGVYDAEDAPDPDQIHKIVRRFSERGHEVVCLQGVLDYYNARTNWLSRCFTIEYATWFRVVLPGIMRLGFAIPLGGTTLFFRRAALEKLGRWDAYNVTEDADLGVRLARYGYRAEIIETVTHEEANCRVIPWIKQRSRWIKGFAATWAVHMRAPRLLWQQLGAWKFLGFQIMFLCTLSQFVLAPLLWSLWLVPLGVSHPLHAILPNWIFLSVAGLFILTEAITIAVGIYAVSGKEHRFLSLWVPTLHFYYPLGALASYKGLWELILSPFYWDKTSHGHFQPADTID
ncbi:glycosyltransferase family 2 protein [Thalassobius sp. I31.1]|uniref:glycosyltransferase family 2 protein n=1 Tax=Thalassobius sp. I31.1 TaxID=2109912 RepID=UPI001E4EE567|nr:glycosyltransferase family 2 protein [Thalassobius sp. I31.1]